MRAPGDGGADALRPRGRAGGGGGRRRARRAAPGDPPHPCPGARAVALLRRRVGPSFMREQHCAQTLPPALFAPPPTFTQARASAAALQPQSRRGAPRAPSPCSRSPTPARPRQHSRFTNRGSTAALHTRGLLSAAGAPRSAVCGAGAHARGVRPGGEQRPDDVGVPRRGHQRRHAAHNGRAQPAQRAWRRRSAGRGARRGARPASSGASASAPAASSASTICRRGAVAGAVTRAGAVTEHALEPLQSTRACAGPSRRAAGSWAAGRGGAGGLASRCGDYSRKHGRENSREGGVPRRARSAPRSRALSPRGRRPRPRPRRRRAARARTRRSRPPPPPPAASHPSPPRAGGGRAQRSALRDQRAAIKVQGTEEDGCGARLGVRPAAARGACGRGGAASPPARRWRPPLRGRG